MPRRVVPVLGLLLASLCCPETVHAGGLEYVAAGTRTLGRGGASLARADDGMALRYNPAALAYLPGYQLSVGSHIGFYEACSARTGTYDDTGVSSTAAFDSEFGFADPTDPNSWVNQPLPRICRSGGPGPSPQLVFSAHPIPELGIAFGLLAPAGVGSSTWGDGEGRVEVDGRLLPSPVRYQSIQQSVLLFHPSIGIGFSPIPEISFGATFMWGISILDVTTMSNIGTGPQDPAQDARARLQVMDPFVPAASFSVHIVPIDALDIMVSARVSDAIDADGSLTVTTGAFGTSTPGSYSPFTTELQGASLRAPQPFEFGFGIRYADRIHPRYRNPEQAGRVTGRVEDRMQNENWDIELDVVYTMNSPVTDFLFRTPPESVGVCEGDRDCINDGTNLDAALPPRIPVAKGWQDQVSIRLGADWNPLPGVLAIRAGTHFETSGLNEFYQAADFIPGMRVGLHLGATLRIDRFDVSIAYAHIFQFDHVVTEGRLRHSASMAGRGPDDEYTCRDAGGNVLDYDPESPVVHGDCYPGGFGSVANNGTISASYDILSVSARYHFE